MSNIFASLGAAARALEAQRAALDVAGQNIANVNTPGYSRRVVDFAAVPPETPHSPGRGVDVIAVRALRDRRLDERLVNELPAEKREAAASQALSLVEGIVGMPGQSLDVHLTRFFDAFSELAQTPTSAVSRQQVQLQGEALAAAFREMAGRLESSRRQIDRDIAAIVESVNEIAGRIASLNTAIASASGQQRLHLEDEQSVAIRALAELLDVKIIARGEGGVDLAIARGQALVVGGTSYGVTATASPPSGLSQIVASSDGTDVTSEIAGGRLGGLIRVRDASLPAYLEALDTIAYEIVGQVNAIHAAGYDQDGNSGGAFFAFSTPPSGVAGSAAAITLSPTIASNPRAIAAAGAPESGDNAAARAIAALRNARVLSNNTATFHDAWAQIVYSVGRDARAAADEQRSRSEIVRQIDALRDQVSGVSLDEEMVQLLKYQRAYEANARFFVAIEETIDLLMDALAR